MREPSLNDDARNSAIFVANGAENRPRLFTTFSVFVLEEFGSSVRTRNPDPVVNSLVRHHCPQVSRVCLLRIAPACADCCHHLGTAALANASNLLSENRMRIQLEAF